MATVELRPGSAYSLAGFFEALGDWSVFAGQTLARCFRRPTDGTLAQCFYVIGVHTAPVVALSGLFIGMVLAIQSYSMFDRFGAASRQATAINVSMIRELGPVLVATMLAGRIGSAMAAELATMKTNEQIDALYCLGVDPVHYLVVPRFLAATLMIPALTVLADFCGVMGGALISIEFYHIDSHHHWTNTRGSVTLWDLGAGLIKPMFFGAAIALIACHRGLNSRPGAEGVGRAATESFVVSFVVILILDFFLAMFLNTLQLLVTEGKP